MCIVSIANTAITYSQSTNKQYQMVWVAQYVCIDFGCESRSKTNHCSRVKVKESHRNNIMHLVVLYPWTAPLPCFFLFFEPSCLIISLPLFPSLANCFHVSCLVDSLLVLLLCCEIYPGTQSFLCRPALTSRTEVLRTRPPCGQNAEKGVGRGSSHTTHSYNYFSTPRGSISDPWECMWLKDCPGWNLFRNLLTYVSILKNA